MTTPAPLPACLDDSPHAPLLSIVGVVRDGPFEYAVVKRRGGMTCRLIDRRWGDGAIVESVRLLRAFFSEEDSAAVASWVRTGSVMPVWP